MYQIIGCFFPTFASLLIHTKISRKATNYISLILYYGTYCTINNLLTLFVVVLRHFNEPYAIDTLTINFCFKYLLVATFFSLITPYLVKVINIRIKIDVEVKKNEKRK